MNERRIGRYELTSFGLKIIAMVTMIIDHTAITFFRNCPEIYTIMRIIGRISFPLFCFVLVEGFFHTRNRKSYALRLFIFALISEIPYNKFGGGILDPSRQNVMFTLLIGFLIIWVIDSIENGKLKYPDIIAKRARTYILNIILEMVVIIAGALIADVMDVVYSYAGILLIICFYESYGNRFRQAVSNIIFNMGMFSALSQWFGVLSAIPIAMYNGKPGSKKGKYFFYLFYPVHLVVLLGIRYILRRI